MTAELSLKQIKKEYHGTLKSYVIGFLTSILLTALSFAIVHFKVLSGPILIFTIVALAITQAIIQLLFFLHLGQEATPRWETLIFYFMVLVLFIIAIGSLWIMYDLNDRVMSNMMEGMSSFAKEMSHD
jgi:cytochrome o ubiquinol oxidase operon protein cyoD